MNVFPAPVGTISWMGVVGTAAVIIEAYLVVALLVRYYASEYYPSVGITGPIVAALVWYGIVYHGVWDVQGAVIYNIVVDSAGFFIFASFFTVIGYERAGKAFQRNALLWGVLGTIVGALILLTWIPYYLSGWLYFVFLPKWAIWLVGFVLVPAVLSGVVYEKFGDRALAYSIIVIVVVAYLVPVGPIWDSRFHFVPLIRRALDRLKYPR